MQSTFDITRSSRNILYKFLEENSLEQLNKIPEGFSNNLIWNIGHIVVVQQMLVYNLSGLPMLVSTEMVDKYKRGTKPENPVSQEEVEQLKTLLFETLNQTKTDFSNGIFKEYKEFTTMSGFNIRTAQEAMEFNNYHEGVHTGIMMRIRKLI
ncbi:MAG TPA: DinB family protein [Flavobacterium sp.]|uniref:DinB family protein n=1 Tax=Flavobacterium sp. TaxID=239 RepID=UPI002BC32146|nr:DinB family protein [Flavobacterium sp.]HSD13836.1 DinB family protein [Flavobacterium sp.]